VDTVIRPIGDFATYFQRALRLAGALLAPPPAHVALFANMEVAP
jgi:hypothetical protein